MSGNHFFQKIDFGIDMGFGIDLGTTTSIVAVATKDCAEVFQTDIGTNYVQSVGG